MPVCNAAGCSSSSSIVSRKSDPSCSGTEMNKLQRTAKAKIKDLDCQFVSISPTSPEPISQACMYTTSPNQTIPAHASHPTPIPQKPTCRFACRPTLSCTPARETRPVTEPQGFDSSVQKSPTQSNLQGNTQRIRTRHPLSRFCQVW